MANLQEPKLKFPRLQKKNKRKVQKKVKKSSEKKFRSPTCVSIKRCHVFITCKRFQMLFLHFLFHVQVQAQTCFVCFVCLGFQRLLQSLFVQERMLSFNVSAEKSNHFVMLKELLPSFSSQHSVIIFIYLLFNFAKILQFIVRNGFNFKPITHFIHSDYSKVCVIIQQINYFFLMKKIILLALVLVLALSSFGKHHLNKAILHPAETLRNLNFTKIVSKWGEIMLHRETEHAQEVVFEENPTISPEPQQLMKVALDTILNVTQLESHKKDFLECKKGAHSEFFKFGAAYVGYIGNKSAHESIVLDRRPDDCFEKVVVNFTNEKHNAINTITVQIFAENKLKDSCTETYVFGTGSKFHVHTFRLRKHHKFVWKNMNELDYNNVVTWGIHVFRLCDTLAHWFPDVIKTAEIFVGGLGLNPKIPFFGSRPTKLMEKLSVDFIEAGTGFRWKEREPKFMNLSQYEVKSGDFLAITRFDGLDQIIQYGAGSHSGHSAMLLQVDGVMNVVESQDGWYWPKHGIQRNDWETWKKWALNAGFNVAVLPLSEESRAKFNVTAAAEHFKKNLEGYPYGYHNFLMGWLDTPKDNYPPVLDPDFVLAMFSYLQRLYEFPINKILTQSLNKKLGVENRKMSEIAVLMARKNMTFGDLMAVVERDEWVYSDGPSLVCSSFVAAMYKAGGLIFDSIQATEMTPRDVYTMNVYDINFKVPAKCKANDPTLPYCQIMGSYLMELPGYATIEPYPHMAERCPTMTPDFWRPDGC